MHVKSWTGGAPKMGAAQKFRRFRKDTICVQGEDQPSWRLKLPGSVQSILFFYKYVLENLPEFDFWFARQPFAQPHWCPTLCPPWSTPAWRSQACKAQKGQQILGELNSDIPYYYIDIQNPGYSSSGFSWFQLTARTHGLKKPLQSPCSFGPLPSQDPRLCRTPNPEKLTMLAALCFRQTTHWQIPSCWDTVTLNRFVSYDCVQV